MGVTVGIIGIIVAFALLIFLVMKDFSPLYAGIIVTFIVILTNRLPIVETVTTVYGPGVASFVAGYFLMMLFGAIMGKLYDISGAATSIARSLVKTFMPNVEGMNIRKKTVIAVLLCALIGGVLTYGGINNVVLMITMYPIAAAICKATDIPQRFAIGMAVTGTSSFAYGGPFTPQMPNITAMDIMGTSSYAAVGPGMIAVAAEVITMCIAFSWVITRAAKKGEHFHPGANDTEWKDDEVLPNPWLSAIPLVVIFVTFNFLKLNVTLAMGLGVILCVILFHKKVKEKAGSLMKVINAGAVTSCSSLLFISAIVGFGATVTSTEAYGVILGKLLGMSIHPYFQLILCIWVMSGISGSATAGVKLALPTLGPIFVGQGLPAAGLHRVGAIACTVTDSLPSCGAIPMATSYSGNTMRESYPSLFISTTLSTAVGTIVCAIFCIILL